jgi:pimeloyl-ACP methyl ester carboxylesterase
MKISENKKTADKSPKRRSLGIRLVKYFLIGVGTILLLICVFVIWIYFSIFSGPSPMDFSEFHPFRSAKAKAEYLAFEEEMEKTWPIISEERFVQTSYGSTFMRISGPLNAPPLILLPGGGSNSIIWKANIKALSEENRTYALDNIYDYGRSVYMRKIEDGEDFANWLNELSDTLDFGNDIRVIGYSYGGWVASQYAIYHPERIEKLVLIAPAFTVLPLTDEYILQMIKTLIPIRYFKKKIMYWVWADLAKMGDWGRSIVENRIDYYQLALKSFKFKQPVNPTVLSDKELRKLTMPVLYLIGENETVYNAHDAISRLHNINQEIRTELINGTGHDLMFTHTDKVNTILLDFLKD